MGLLYFFSLARFCTSQVIDWEEPVYNVSSGILDQCDFRFDLFLVLVLVLVFPIIF